MQTSRTPATPTITPKISRKCERYFILLCVCCIRVNIFSFCRCASTAGSVFFRRGGRHLSADNSCKADAHSSVSLWALTSSFGYNYLPRSGFLSAFVNGASALPEEINLSHFLLGFLFLFFLRVADLIFGALAEDHSAGSPFLPGVPFVFTVARLLAYLCEWSLRR